MDFFLYAGQRSTFTLWFVPIGFTVLALEVIWQEPAWSWFEVIAVLFALYTWATFAVRRRQRSKPIGVAKA